MNLKALDSRFLSICCSRLASVNIDRGSSSPSWMSKPTALVSATVAEGALDVTRAGRRSGSSPTSTAIVPDSIFARSRMSLISDQQVGAGRVDRLGELLLLGRQVALGVVRRAWSDRMSRLLSGVRSSWDMLARNSDLYLRGQRQLLGLLLQASLACSISRFLPSTSCSGGEQRAFLQLLVGLLSSSCCSSAVPRILQRRGLLLQPGVLPQLFLLACSSWASDCDCFSRPSVPHVGRDGVEHDADRLGELVEEAQVDVG